MEIELMSLKILDCNLLESTKIL